jgi:hypothetical protein
MDWPAVSNRERSSVQARAPGVMDSIRIDSWCTPTMIAPPGEIVIVDQPPPLDQNTDPSVGTSVKRSTLL